MRLEYDPMSAPIAAVLPTTWSTGLWNCAWLRVSARQKDKLANNAEAANVLHRHPAMQRVDEVGGVTQLLTNRALQRKLGLIELRRRDASAYAEEPGALMGYIWVIEELQCVLVLLTDSAAELNVSVPGEPLPGNAAMHLLQNLLLMPNVLELHAASWDRLIRETRMGAAVVAAAQQGHTKIYSRGQLIDLYTPGGKSVATYETSGAAGIRDFTREATTNGALGKLTREEIAWPYSRRITPPGYVAIRDESGDGVGEKRIALLRADSEFTHAWTDFFRAVAEGSSWPQCGRLLATAKVPARAQKYHNKTFADLTARQLAKAARTAASLKHIRELRTLTYQVDKEVPVPNNGTWNEYSVSPGGIYGAVRLSVALPDHGIGLTDQEWDACETRVSTSTSRVPTGDRLASMGASIPSWQDAATGLHYKLHSYPGYYHLRARSAAESLDDYGTPRGWLTGEGELIASFAKADFDRALSDLVEQAGEDLLHAGAVFARPAARNATPREEVDCRLRALAMEREAAADHAEVCQGAVALATDVNRQARESKLAEALASLQDIDSAIAKLEATPVPVKRTEQVSVDLAEFAALAGVLREAAGTRMPRVVNDAFLQLVGRSLRVVCDPTRPLLTVLTATLRARDTDGGLVEVPVHTTVRNARLAVRAGGQRAADGAALIFGEGVSVDQAASMLGVLPTRLAKEVRTWARRNGVADDRLAGKLIDCPIVDVGRIAWALMTDTDPVGDTEFVAAVREGYFERGRRPRCSSWVTPTADQRRVLRALELAEGRGSDLTQGVSARDIASATGLTSAEVLQMAGRGDDRCSLLLRRHPADPRIVLPWTCCSCGRWLLHVMLTEETRASSGLVCVSCGISGRGDRLPADYRRLWDVDPETGRTVERTIAEYKVAIPGHDRQRRVGMGEAVRLTGIASHVLRTATENRNLPCVRRGGTRERWFDVRDLEAFAERHNAGSGRVPSTSELPEGHMTLKDAAARYGVAVHVLRRLVLSTDPDVGPVRYVRTTAGRANVIAARVADLDALDPDWFSRHRAGLLRLSDVLDRTGLTPAQLRRLMAVGDFPHTRTDRGTAVFVADDVDAWMDGPGRVFRLLAPREAAALIGATPDQLRNAHERGELPARRTSSGHRRYAEADVREWDVRRSSTVDGAAA